MARENSWAQVKDIALTSDGRRETWTVTIVSGFSAKPGDGSPPLASSLPNVIQDAIMAWIEDRP